MTRARDMANLGSQAGSGLDASDITSGALGASVTGGAGLGVSTAATTAFAPKASPTFTGTATFSGDIVPSTPLSNRNMVINGGMQVWQRGTTSTAGGNPAYLTADRWGIYNNTTGQEISQQADAPEGFKYSYRFKCTASVVPGVSDYIYIPYKIEGQDLQHLKKGIANAEAITISFWVKSNKNATYQLNIIDETNSRIIGATYAISSAATWEKKTITFAGDTTGGTIDNDNTTGFTLEWFLDSGINLKSGALPTAWEGKTDADRNAGGTVEFRTTNDYFQITGIQLELGSNATPFEHRSYGDELARCQRYYNKVVVTGGVVLLMGRFSGSTGGAYCNYNYPVSMRAASQNFEISEASTWYGTTGYSNGTFALSASNTDGCTFYSDNNTNVVANGLIFCQPSGSGTTYFAFEKEL